MSKVLMSAKCESLGRPGTVSPIASVAVEALARLMVEAYEGTADWEEGDDAEVAAAEIRATFAGEYGAFNDSASAVIFGDSGEPVSALFISNFEGRATILFVYTAKSASGRGYATALIRNAAYHLDLVGVEEVFLYVSSSNPAGKLYEKLGFSEK